MNFYWNRKKILFCRKTTNKAKQQCRLSKRSKQSNSEKENKRQSDHHKGIFFFFYFTKLRCLFNLSIETLFYVCSCQLFYLIVPSLHIRQKHLRKKRPIVYSSLQILGISEFLKHFVVHYLLLNAAKLKNK